MRIDNQDIVSMTRGLRDEENQQLHVRPWNRRNRFHLPAWLAAIPAAAVIGFLLGLWVNSRQPAEAPLSAMVDTVYIKVKDTADAMDTAYAVTATPRAHRVVSKKTVRQRSVSTPQGQSMANDRIRYDLLVKH